MSQSIKQRMGAISNGKDAAELRKVLEAVLVDLTALRSTVAALVTDNANRVANHNTLIAKLNADDGVTDADYAAATAATSSAPSALTTSS